MGQTLGFLNKTAIWLSVTGCPWGPDPKEPPSRYSACVTCRFNVMHPGQAMWGCTKELHYGRWSELLRFLEEFDPKSARECRALTHELGEQDRYALSLEEMALILDGVHSAQAALSANPPAPGQSAEIDESYLRLVAQLLDAGLRLRERVQLFHE